MQNWLTKQAELSPNQLALISGPHRLTFKALQSEVSDLAAHLAACLDDNPRVALLTTNSVMGYELILALQQLGREIVLLNYRLSANELAYQLKDANVTQVLLPDEAPQTLLNVELIRFKAVLAAPKHAVKMVDEFDLNQVTTIMYTSGTTGYPKGVQQTFGNHFYSAVNSVLNLGLTPNDCWLAVVPIFHISGLSIMMRSLIYGMTVQLVDHFDASDINAVLMQGEVTTVSVVPTMLKDLLATLPEGMIYPDSLKTMLLGGGPADLTVLKQAQQAGVNVVQSYGMTETASQVVALNPNDALQKVGSVGKPLFMVELQVKDPNVQGIGRVQIKSPTLTVGYLNQPEKYQDSFNGEWFDTGDMGYLDQDQFLYLVGREGDMISSGGENVFPDEVESVYRALDAVKEVTVVSVSDDKWGERPVAVLEFEPNQHLSEADLVAYGRQRIAHYKVPKAFYQMVDGQWPKTASGKIQRYRVKQQLSDWRRID